MTDPFHPDTIATGNRFRYIELFAGIGGLGRAIDAVGGECVVQVEREPYCLDILRRRWPDVPKHPDVTDFHPEPVDLVVGGPPCQPVSHAGRRKGTDDDRWLWGEALRVVREAQPARVFFENPMGLRTLGLDAILAELTDMGYGGAWEVVAAADVGAPHLRKRIFIMGDKGRDDWEGPTRPAGNHSVGMPTPTARLGGQRGPQAKRYFDPARSNDLDDYVAAFPQTRWPTPTTRDWEDSGDSIANGTVPVNGLPGRAVAPTKASGALSPDWVCWLMGFPIGWTDITCDDPGPLYSWESEPDIPRIGLGIPNRSKRLTALGNAVVPAQAMGAWQRLNERLAAPPVRVATLWDMEGA